MLAAYKNSQGDTFQTSEEDAVASLQKNEQHKKCQERTPE